LKVLVDISVWSQSFIASPADVVITDTMMNKNGLEVIRDLKASCPDVKIIAITGHGSEFLDAA
jgi:DNA-binding NarL/FixJ family response regulator